MTGGFERGLTSQKDNNMKRVKQEVLKLTNCQVMRNVRSDLAERMRAYWVGKPTSNIGLQYLSYNEGLITVRQPAWERTDILWLSVDNACNVFIEPDGSTQIDAYDGVEFTSEEFGKLKQLAAKVYAENAEYVAHEKRFLESKPWLQVDGMTPERAVEKFIELGWGSK